MATGFIHSCSVHRTVRGALRSGVVALLLWAPIPATAGMADQIGTPFEIYNRPTTKFVANFVGTLNTLDGEVSDPATGKIRVAGQEITLGRPVPSGKITLASRPEMISLGASAGRETHLRARISSVHFLGSVIRIRADLGGTEMAFDTFNTSDAPPPKVGGEVDLSLAGRDLLVLND